jgi:hypothetical protein
VRLVLLGQPGDELAAVAAQLSASSKALSKTSSAAAVHCICCESPEHAPAWNTLDSQDLVLLIENANPLQMEWRTRLMSIGQSFQVLHRSGESLLQALQWALGHHLQRTTGHSPWPLRTEIAPRWQGVCETCSDPECEHRLFRQLVSNQQPT